MAVLLQQKTSTSYSLGDATYVKKIRQLIPGIETAIFKIR